MENKLDALVERCSQCDSIKQQKSARCFYQNHRADLVSTKSSRAKPIKQMHFPITM